MIIRSQVHNTLRAKALLLPGNMVHIIASLCAILLFVALFIVSISPVQAQTADYPEPLQPANNATDIGVTNITFTWSPYYVGTDKYTFQIATNTEFADNDIVFKTVVSGTTYVYKATALSYDTTYWWRVMASEPLGGNWSPIQRFSTKINTPATPAPEPEESDSFFSSIKDFFTDADPLMIGLIAAGVIVVVLAIYVVFLQPASKKSAARSQQAPPPTFGGASPQAGARCPQCGSPNTPGRKFCGSCGANLSPTPPPAPPPPPPPPPSQPSWNTRQQSGTGTCPACAMPNPPGRAFCSNCGSALTAAPQSPAQPAWSSPQERICTTCGTSNASGKKFCGNCGASLESGVPQQQIQIGQSYTCPVCGAPIAPGANPCASCGTWLDWS